ncbi:MAG: hypothetical protein LUQ20_01190 [Candidatus Methanoperedens sp.]|nr:hypothetical protein [Candidatus Methanoperedens sp.]
MCYGEIEHGCHGFISPRANMAHGMCSCGSGGRRFLSKKERIEMLEEYLESLKSEMEGVEEELKEFKSE